MYIRRVVYIPRSGQRERADEGIFLKPANGKAELAPLVTGMATAGRARRWRAWREDRRRLGLLFGSDADET
eukprot:1181827-Prorocentrum_minimum.AAC.5